MSGGASGGKSKGKQSSEAASQLQDLATGIIGSQSGLNQQFIGAMKQFLNTGGKTPHATFDPRGAEEASRAAQAQTMRHTHEQLVRSNLAGTPAGESILAQARMAGAQARSQIAPQMHNQSQMLQNQNYMQMMQLIPSFLTGNLGAMTSGLSAAVPGNVKSKGQQTGGFLGGILPF